MNMSIQTFPSSLKVLMALEWDVYRDGRMFKEASTLSACGAEIKLVGFRSELSPPPMFPFRAITLPIFPRRWRRLRQATIVLNLILLNCWLIFQRSDIYHVHNTLFLPGAFLASRLYRRKIVFDCREVMEEAHLVMAWLEKIFIRRVDLVINVSEGRADYQAARYGIPRSRILVIHNYAELPKIDRRPEDLPDLPRLLFCGGYNLSDNRLDDFLEILQEIPDVQFHIIGFEYGNSGQKLEKMVRALKMEDRVRFFPPVPYNRIWDVMSQYDIGVNMLTNYENSITKRFPAICKNYAYMAAGLPIICSDMEAFREEVEALGVGITIDLRNKQAAREKILALLKDRPRILEMRSRALHLARTRFNWEVESKKLVEAYLTLLALQGKTRVWS